MKNGKSRRNRRSTPINDEDKPETKLDRNTPDVETKGPMTPVRRNHEKGENCFYYKAVSFNDAQGWDFLVGLL